MHLSSPKQFAKSLPHCEVCILLSPRSPLPMYALSFFCIILWVLLFNSWPRISFCEKNLYKVIVCVVSINTATKLPICRQEISVSVKLHSVDLTFWYFRKTKGEILQRLRILSEEQFLDYRKWKYSLNMKQRDLILIKESWRNSLTL